MHNVLRTPALSAVRSAPRLTLWVTLWMALAVIALAAHALPRDANGWTVFTPSADTRLIYVSSSEGSNATAQWYAPTNAVIGGDPFNPTGAVKAYATLSNAFLLARNGYPDWVLLKRGDTFYESLSLRDGRTNDERFVYGAYGGATNRPVLKVGSRSALSGIAGIEYAAVVSLDFYAHTRDPNSPEYTGGEGSTLLSILNIHYSGTNIVALLVEDCLLRFGVTDLIVQNFGTCSDVVIRRNVLVDSYSTNSHSQGMYAHHAPLVLEENVFDHCGWLVQGNGDNKQGLGGATMFNHDTYFSTCFDVLFRNNIFLRSSSINNKWTANEGYGCSTNLAMIDNLYVDGEIGISIGGNTMGPLRFAGISILSNVFYDIGLSRPTGRTLGWGIELIEWDGGVVGDNLLLHNTNTLVNNVYGINLTGSGSRNVRVRDNVLHGLRAATGIMATDASSNQCIAFSGNKVQFPGLDARLARTYTVLSAISFEDSTYYTDRASGTWFYVTGTDRPFAYWQTSLPERSAVAHKLTFPAADRTIESYMASIGETPTREAFIAAVRAQSKMNWRPELCAHAINEYFREGFRSLDVATTDLPGAMAGQPYNAALAAVNASGDVYWTMHAGALPGGLSLGSNGVISGTAHAVAVVTTSSFAVLAHDAVNVDPKTLSIVVIPEPGVLLGVGVVCLRRRRS